MSSFSDLSIASVGSEGLRCLLICWASASGQPERENWSFRSLEIDKGGYELNLERGKSCVDPSAATPTACPHQCLRTLFLVYTSWDINIEYVQVPCFNMEYRSTSPMTQHALIDLLLVIGSWLKMNSAQRTVSSPRFLFPLL